MAEMLRIEFEKLSGMVPPADRLRSVRSANGVLLMASKRRPMQPMGAATAFFAFQTTLPRAGWSEVVNLQEVVPAEINWDVAISDGRPEIVRERPSGATNSLALWTTVEPNRALTADYPLQSFSEPRFVKAAHPPRWMTAIVDNQVCVAISLVGAEPYQKLGECAGGLLVQNGTGFAFVYKTNVPGPARGKSILPGRLNVASFDAELHPSGSPMTVFEGVVFEFDVDVIANKLVIIATTPNGVMVSSHPIQGLAPKWTTAEQAIPMLLISPTIAGGASGKAFVAALNSSDPGAASIVTAEMTVP